MPISCAELSVCGKGISMISPHTSPGTKVVCIDANSDGKYMSAPWIGGLGDLQQGQIYTVKAIYPTDRAISGFAVLLYEIERDQVQGWAIDRFRYLDLPSCISDALNVQPVKDKAEELAE
jgi:hypothetical protein